MRKINGLYISNVTVFPVKNKTKRSKLLALARVELNDSVQLTGITVIEGPKKLWVNIPGGLNNTIIPELEEHIKEHVLAEFALTSTSTIKGE